MHSNWYRAISELCRIIGYQGNLLQERDWKSRVISTPVSVPQSLFSPERFPASATSSRSCSLSAGIRTIVIPARWAAISFSGSPPIGMTPPRRETSPVMAYSGLTFFPVRSDARAVVSVIPAHGPSFGTAPAGTWIRRSCSSSTLLSFR